MADAVVSDCIESQVPTVDLCAYRGDTFEHHFIWYDEDGQPIDLIGESWAARLQVRKSARSSGFEIEVDNTSGISLGTEGQIDLEFAVEIDNESNVYDLEMTDQNGVVTTIVRGAFNVVQDVSRDVT